MLQRAPLVWKAHGGDSLQDLVQLLLAGGLWAQTGTEDAERMSSQNTSPEGKLRKQLTQGHTGSVGGMGDPDPIPPKKVAWLCVSFYAFPLLCVHDLSGVTKGEFKWLSLGSRPQLSGLSAMLFHKPSQGQDQGSRAGLERGRGQGARGGHHNKSEQGQVDPPSSLASMLFAYVSKPSRKVEVLRGTSRSHKPSPGHNQRYGDPPKSDPDGLIG